MSLESILQQAAALAGTFSPRLVIFLFLICAIGEFGLSVPYLLENVWLLSGFHFATGALSVFEPALLWLAAQLGRQTGAAMLYHLSRFGSSPLIKLYGRYFGRSQREKTSNDAKPLEDTKRRSYLSPFAVALGRLLWLRIPLTLTLGARKRLQTLSLGILLSSLVWDGVYITIGMVVGTKATLKPFQLVPYSLVGLTFLYGVTFGVQRLLKRRPSFGRGLS
jgi:membrane-associated protein